MGVLAALVLVPLLLLVARFLPFPGAGALAGSLTLNDLPEELRQRAAFVLILPLGALVVVLVRQTLGVRMLGPFRSLLLAAAFEVTGVVPGLTFLAVVGAVTVGIRPALKAMQLPYFGRVCTLLGTVAALMVLGILGASRLELTVLEKVVYLPVVVLCLIGEGFGRTLAVEGPRSAAARGATTVAVALLITAIARIPGLDDLLLAHPELVLVEVAAVIAICEYFDLRLLEKQSTGGEAADGCPAEPAPAALPGGPRVAVVRNESTEGVICRFGRPSPEKYGPSTVRAVLEALRARGYVAELFEADVTMLPELREFLADPDTGRPRGIVFNMAYGIQGEARYTHAPAMLEMAGLPYTGADPLGHAISLDKVIAKIAMRDAGIPTPAFRVVRDCREPVTGLRYPLVVKPRHESTSNGLHIARDPGELARAVADVVASFDQDALVEEFIDGREFCIGMVGNDPVTCLPPVELDFGTRELPIFTKADKFHQSGDEPSRICPARMSDKLRERLETMAITTARACRTRDYARVDFRVDRRGRPFVLEINSMASLGAGGSFVHAARCAGYSFESLIEHIVQSATARAARDAARPGRESPGAAAATAASGAAASP